MGVLIAIVYSIFILSMMTLGAVLLVNLWLRHLSQGLRIVIAAVIGPSSIFVLPFLASAFTTDVYFRSSAGSTMVGLLIVIVVLTAIIGLPVAYFATRKLDRMLEISASIFE